MTVVEFNSLDSIFDKFGSKLDDIVAGNGAVLLDIISSDLGKYSSSNKDFQYVLLKLIRNISCVSEGKYDYYFSKITKTFTSIFFGFLGGYNLNYYNMGLSYFSLLELDNFSNYFGRWVSATRDNLHVCGFSDINLAKVKFSEFVSFVEMEIVSARQSQGQGDFSNSVLG